MPEQLEIGTDASKTPPPATNRKKLIQETARLLANFEAEKKVITDRISELKQTNIKGRLGMTIAVFNAARAAYKLEHDDRTKWARDYRECWEALEIGEQLDWIDATGADPEANGADGEGQNEGGYTFQTGVEAGLAGKNRDANPMLEGSAAAATWDRGWLHGQQQLGERFVETHKEPEHDGAAAAGKRRRGRPKGSHDSAPRARRGSKQDIFH